MDYNNNTNNNEQNKSYSSSTQLCKPGYQQHNQSDKFKYLFDNAVDAIFIISLDGHILDVNHQACVKYGYSKDDFTTMMVSELDMVKNQQAVEERIDYLLKNKIDTFRTIHQTSDNKQVYTEITSKLITLDNEPLIMSSCRDVSRLSRVQKEIISSKEQLDCIVRTIPCGLGIVSVDRKMRFVNQTFAEMIGYSKDELTDQEVRILYPDNAEYNRVGKAIYPTLERHGSGELETRFKTKEGKIIDIVLNYSLIDSADFSKGLTFAVSNITRQKKMANALEERIIALTQPLDSLENIAFDDLFNLEEIQKIQDSFSNATGVASLITDTNGNPITKSSNFCRLCHDIIRKSPKGEANCKMSDAKLSSIKNKGPKVITCYSAGLWDAGASITVAGKHIANWLIGQVRNETQTEEQILKYADEIGVDRKETLEAFREVPQMSDEQFKSIAETLSLMANQLSNMAYQNIQQARFISEKKKNEEIIQNYNETLKKEVTKQTQELARKNSLLNHKIAEHKKTEEMLKKTQNQLIQSEKLASIGQLAAGVAHEINTPLGAIGSSNTTIKENFDDITFALEELTILFNSDGELIKKLIRFIMLQETNILSTRQQRQLRQTIAPELQDKTTIDPEYLAKFFVCCGLADCYEQFLPLFNKHNSDKIIEAVQKISNIYQGSKVIQEAINQSSRIVFALREYAHSNETQVKQQANIKHTLETAITLYNNKMKYGIELILDLEDTPAIKCYPGELNQVWTNLIHNAVQAMNGSGILQISLKNIKDNIEVKITDSGCGIAQDIKSEIFKPLFTTKQPGMGTGLGLDIVSRIIKRHKGNIKVESIEGQGATFTVTLPVD